MFGFVGLVCLISVEQEKMDKSAFEQKARTWREKAVSASLHYGAGREEAEDIAQDVMLRLCQSVEAIVTIMARHQLRNHQRRKRGEALDEAKLMGIETSPQTLLEIKEDEVWLERKLQQMPTTQRTLLYMRQVERRSHEEIASLLGIEITSVSTLLARARHTLLEEIKRRNKI